MGYIHTTGFCFLLIFIAMCLSSPSNIDSSIYEEGRKQFAVIQHNSQMPKYGICWKNAMVKIQNGCKKLTDDVQSRLALAYLNCFLTIQGRQTYECEQDDVIEKCTQDMADVDRGSFTTMFTHTQNICYFLEAQIWHEEMDLTIDRLSNSSSRVGQQLEESFRMQMDMIEQQNESLKNQQKIINQALDLRVLINDVFDRVSKLQSLVLGEFSGFYSIIYYLFSIILCYLLTSTPRTSGARFWLFGVMTVNMLLEQMIIIYVPEIFITDFPIFKDEEELIFSSQRFLRKISAATAIVILTVFACKYQDISVLNSQLLIEIRKQNSDIKRMFQGVPSPNQGSNSYKPYDYPDSRELNSVAVDSTTQNSDNSVSGYSSDTSVLSTGDTDKTFSLLEEADDDDTTNCESDSYVTVTTDAANQSLLNELNDIRNSTPIRQLSNQLASWIDTGFFNFTNEKGDPEPVASTSETIIKPRYNLRTRKVPSSNPTINTESPKSFQKTVKNMEKISRRNNRLTQAMMKRKQNLSQYSDN
ncbi:uncharacterized protein LOC126827428 [Patella vulgata]|uniref:uncharacterized protein LOC126827428 n=1 Tax=Patella vulgata TaxID=6465 RepID=UPI00217F23F3|nr:uncharacterized protein LOC126827428 [Patella vulgata]